MDNLLSSAEIVLPLFTLMAVGYGLSRIGIFNDEFLSVCNKFCFKVLLPVLLFMNISGSDFETAFQPGLIAYAIAAVTVVFAILCVTVPLCVRDPLRRGVVIQAAFRTNYLLFGTPLCVNMFGAEGGAVASVLAAFIVPLFNIFAVVTLAATTNSTQSIPWKKTFYRVATNPLIIGASLGLVFVWFRWSLPDIIHQPMNDIAKIATPLSLLMLGGDFRFKRIVGKLRILTLTTFCRLVAVPVAALTTAALLGFRGPSYAVLLALFGSPVAVSSYVMAKTAGADGELAGQLVVLTTCFSILTIFGLVYVSRSLGLL